MSCKDFINGYKFFLLTGIVCGFLSYPLLNSDYNKKKPYAVTVMGKEMIPGGSKSSGHPVMSIRFDDGNYHDMYPSFSTYSRFNVGDRFMIEYSDAEIHQTTWGNIVYFFLPVLLMAVFISTVIALPIAFLFTMALS